MFPAELLQKCWFLVGPTASGKTEISLALARHINAEIVALDSMTLYRGMDIGTAKVSLTEQALVRHHLIDILDPSQEFSLAEYLQAAEACCRDVLERGRVPLFVGGSGLYLRGLLKGVFQGPSADWSIRNQLEADAAQLGPEHLHRELAKIDPTTAERLHPNDVRRVIRAIEVHHLTGKPLSEHHLESSMALTAKPVAIFVLSPSRSWLHSRIDARVHSMIANGLIGEVVRLLQAPSGLSRTAQQALAYRELIEWINALPPRSRSVLNSSTQLPAGLVKRIQAHTRQFAKRQETWFRSIDERLTIPIEEPFDATAIVERILAARASNLSHS